MLFESFTPVDDILKDLNKSPAMVGKAIEDARSIMRRDAKIRKLVLDVAKARQQAGSKLLSNLYAVLGGWRAEGRFAAEVAEILEKNSAPFWDGVDMDY